MDGREYLLGVQPMYQVMAEVLLPGNPMFSRVPGMYAVKVVNLPILSTSYEDRARDVANMLSIGDIILVSGFTTVYSTEQLRSDAAENSWNSVMASELRYTQRMVEESSNHAETGHPIAVEEGTADSLNHIGGLVNTTINRALEAETTLYASINPNNIFGKVLQGCAR